MICRLGCVRISQMPGSRFRMRAAPSNSWSIASKTLPGTAISSLNDLRNCCVIYEKSKRSKLTTLNRLCQFDIRCITIWHARGHIIRSDEDRGRQCQGAVAAEHARTDIAEIAGAEGAVYHHFRAS